MHAPARVGPDLAQQDDVRIRALRGMPRKESSFRERIVNGSGIADRGVPCLRRGGVGVRGMLRVLRLVRVNVIYSRGGARGVVSPSKRSSLVVEASVASLPCGY